MTPFQETIEHQRRAATPSQSAFVMANAGSGKTRVLTNRVARLLLAGTPPQKVLCITFTKAAAAEMAERLFSVLGEWALCDDDALLSALEELEGERIQRDGDALAKARRLFARALETPGGLKIQTIHSFCESVLRRFPLEAGVPPGFSVIEDAATFELLNTSLDMLAADAGTAHDIEAGFQRLSATRGEDQLRSLLIGGALSGVAGSEEDLENELTQLARDLRVPGEKDSDAIRAGFVAALSDGELKRVVEGLAASGKQPQDAAQRLSPIFEADRISDKWLALEAFFLTASGSPRKKIATAATDKHDPWIKPYVTELQSQFVDVLDQLKALSIYLDTEAYWRLSSALRARYENGKAVRAALDFNDLIDRARTLFSQVDNAWVMYKLDYGIDHILVDEAQDTSPGQWSVVESLFDDFFSGSSAREAPRSFFAVGDLKQSIYSFQGADVALFKEKEQGLGARLSQVTHFESLPLSLSFRTTAPVLSFVDAAFSEREAAEGLGDEIPVHGVHREGQAGLVELWPLTPRPETPKPNPWDAPVDETESDHPVRVLCERISSTVKEWLQKGELLESQGRCVRPGDILILVQSRGALFTEIIQRLSAAGVPVAGPDRLKLAEDPAVEDLLSYARFCLCAADDLSLAEVLKSPLFGFEDDRDLFPLAHERGQRETLWGSLRRRRDENARWALAVEQISAARKVATFQGPFAFFTHVLESGAPSGRRRFFERMGNAPGDALGELLRQAMDFENANPRTLRGFVDWFDRAATDVKREMERQDDAVRVMTVHGSKGLEAEIVFLLDAHREVNLNSVGPVIDGPAGALLVGAKGNDVPITAEAREDIIRKRYEEYRRLFYVASTRARDRLYICGVESGKNKDPHSKPINQKTWHALSEDAFDRLAGRVERSANPFWGEGSGGVLRLSCVQEVDAPEEGLTSSDASVEAPDWLFKDAARETATASLSPSKLGGEEDEDEPSKRETGAYSPTGARDKYFRGRVLHRLLELLPDIEDTERSTGADKLLAHLAADIDEVERGQWREEVLTLMRDPAFSAVFAKGSMAEVPIAGHIGKDGKATKISGLIDRLWVSDDKVLVVDYKTNRPPPKDVRDADPAYVAQMAAYRVLLQEIYPDRQISCALLWTYDARLMEVPADMLDHAAVRAGLTG